jgi:hypothetical protein
MECQSIDLMWPIVVLALVPFKGNVVPSPLVPGPSGSQVRWCGAVSASMGLLGVKGIAAPEVKFLDRRKTTGGKGALQVHVRRSRMRVWGAKMIRHRRSPPL